MKRLAMLLVLCGALLVPSTALWGHCDTMNGPVVMAAHKSLETGDINHVLVWIQKKDEKEITEAFRKARTVRLLGEEAKQLADMYFFETVVRVHRAGEGVAYTGLKPAETEIEPGIRAADIALEKGSVEPLIKSFSADAEKRIREGFAHVMEKKGFPSSDLAAGRAYVAAYVGFIHYVEGVYQAVGGSVGGHLHEAREEAFHDSHEPGGAK